MATPTRHLCRTIFQIGRRLPAKRKWQPQCLRASARGAPPVRSLSYSSIRKADSPNRNRRSIQDRGDSENIDRTIRSAGSESVEDDGRFSIDPERYETVDGEEGAYLSEAEAAQFELGDTSVPDPSEYLTPSQPIVAEEVTPEEIAAMKEILNGQPGDPIGLYNHLMALAESLEEEKDLDPAIMNEMENDIADEEDVDFPVDVLTRAETGWWADSEEDDEFALVEDADDEHDDSDITSVAHSELEVHREIREYTRVVAWDMPLLTNFAKEFKPPTESQPLRFRYTTYMGESHPAARKVVVQFCTKDLPNLTEEQRVKLVKLVGPRYNPDTDLVKMSSEKFEAPAQNKRYLGDLVNKLIDEAKNGADKFEDIPLDVRHHKAKKINRFPEEWKLTPDRVQQLLSARKEQKLLADSAPARPLDGKEFVGNYLQSLGMKAMSSQRIV